MTKTPPRDAPKRFYQSVTAERLGDGWTVLLDGRSLKTPARAALLLPTRRLAEIIAREWDQQAEQINVAAMPLTRLANVAIDRTPEMREEMAEEVMRFCETDLLCHLAEEPDELVDDQTRLWAPVRNWAEEALDIHLVTVEGVMASPQPPSSIDAAGAYALGLDDFRLTGLVYACGLYGSALLGLAVIEEALDAMTAFDYSRVDEAWQAVRWGEDEEAKAATEIRRTEAGALRAWIEALAD